MNPHILRDAFDVIQNPGDARLRFSGKRILLTGAAGFLGSQFMHSFATLNDTGELASHCTVIAIDKSKRSVAVLLRPHHRGQRMTMSGMIVIIIGTGYVGLVSGVCLPSKGADVFPAGSHPLAGIPPIDWQLAVFVEGERGNWTHDVCLSMFEPAELAPAIYSTISWMRNDHL